MHISVSVSVSVSSLQQKYRNRFQVHKQDNNSHSRNYCVSTSLKLSMMNYEEGLLQEIQRLVKSKISEDFSSSDESEASDSLISQLLALEDNYLPTPASNVPTQMKTNRRCCRKSQSWLWQTNMGTRALLQQQQEMKSCLSMSLRSLL
jgi:hypothetical protein